MKSRSKLFCVLSLGVVMGCAGNQARRDAAAKDMPLPKPPPAVPARHDDPINTTLQQAARNRVLEAFAANDPLLRANAVESAQDGLASDAPAIVADALKDRDYIVRFAGAMAAGQLRLTNLHDRLAELANDPSVKVRIGARYALHRIGDPRLSHDLEKLAQDPNPRVREDVAFVLGRLGEKSGLNILHDMSGDSDAQVRLQVAEAAWRLGDEHGLEVLVTGTLSQFADDRMLSLMGLVAPKDRRVEQVLRGKLTDAYTEVDLVAARALGEIGLDDGYGVALKSINSADPRQRLLAAMALGAIGRSDAQLILAPLLSDPDNHVRLGAATAMLKLKAPSTAAAR